MPQWLRQQLMKAYFKKDCRQIRLLNECWFFTGIPPIPTK
ncbi:cortex morphogenetic protein CmpA [Paenibacillus rhizoplanae]